MDRIHDWIEQLAQEWPYGAPAPRLLSLADFDEVRWALGDVLYWMSHEAARVLR